MKRNRILQKRIVRFVAVITLLGITHHLLLRPWFLDWGAPDRIRALSLPGDILVQGKGHTRAVSIEASPQEIWPWLVQMGQDRGGMYSYSWLENLIRADIHNVYEIRQTLQEPRKEGDTIWLANPKRYNGRGHQIVAMYKHELAFVMVGGDDYNRIVSGEKARGAWCFYLYPETSSSTWLIARSAGDGFPMGDRVLRYLSYEVPHFIMERKMLRTIRRLAEQRSRGRDGSGIPTSKERNLR